MPTLESLKAEHPEWCFICGHGGGLCGGNAHVQHRSPVIAALTAAKLEDEATIREKDARIAELEKDPDDSSWRYRYEDCQKALDVHQRLLEDRGFPLLSLCEALGWQGGTVHQVLREVASLRAQLSCEQAAHAATKEELRKADEAVKLLREALGPRKQGGYLTCMDCGGLIRDAEKPKGSRTYGHRGWCRIAPALASTEALARIQAQRAADAAKEE